MTALLKQFIVKGVALSLICIATLAKAEVFNVTNNNNTGPGSLPEAVRGVNDSLSRNNEIKFNAGLDINLRNNLPSFTTLGIVKIFGAANLKIHQNEDLTKVIFDAGTAGELHLVGFDIGGNSNWHGGISSGAGSVVRLEQRTSSIYSGKISGTGEVRCEGLGETLTFNSTNTYTGDTVIESGATLRIAVENALPTDAKVNVSDLGTFDIGAGLKQTLAGLTGDGFVNNAGTLEIASATNATFSGIIIGAGKLVKKGAAVFTLTGSNTYTGPTEILTGTLRADALLNNALPITNTVTVSSNAILEIADNRSQTLQSIAGDGRVNIDNAATLTAATIADGSFEGDIMATGTGAFVKGGTNTLALSKSHPNAGDLQIVGGGIKIPTGGSWNGPVTIAAATLEMDGGIVTDAIRGNGLGTSILNITKDFTPVVSITDIGTVNVHSGGTLFLTNDIAGVTGSVVNEGTITHTASAIRNIAEDFTQETAGIINVGITNLAQYSQFQVNGITTLNGGVMNIQAPSNVEIKTGDVFDIITSTGGITNNTLPTVQKPSLFLGFRPIITGNRLQLVAERSGCMCINTIPPLTPLAQKLDSLSTNDNFKPVLGILTQQPSQRGFEDKLEQLAPTGLNGIHTAMAQESGGSKEVFSRLDAVRTGGVLARTGYIGTGYAAGDVMEDQGSYGPIIFGNSTKQSSIEGLSGYKAITAGFGFLGDAPILDHFRAGLGASYANSVVRQSNNTGSHTTIGSAQGMAYGSATYGRLFLDAVLSAGINNYHAKRNVNFMGITATSRYTGFQCGAKIKTGFAIPFHQINISPIVAVQYMHLNVGQYIEKDAGTLNQHLSAMRTNTVRVNLGGKIAEKRLEGTFFPEFHTFYIVDVKNPQVTLTSRFLEGGGSFDSKTVVPPKHGVSLGASVTALISDSFTLSGGYDLEKKSSFKSHSASLKFKFLF